MCNSFPPTGHDTITQLNDLRNSNYLFGMIPLIRQQHQEKKDIRNNCFRLPEKKKCKVLILNCTTPFSKNEHFFTVRFFFKNVLFCFYTVFLQLFFPLFFIMGFFPPKDFYQALTITQLLILQHVI